MRSYTVKEKAILVGFVDNHMSEWSSQRHVVLTRCWNNLLVFHPVIDHLYVMVMMTMMSSWWIPEIRLGMPLEDSIDFRVV
jgi:4-hydroxyphenylpyruvate dioxygenase-like putative hemolysin